MHSKALSMCSITAVVLTHNEEVNISHCLNSLTWCEKRIVLDSGSTDRTVEVAREEGAEIAVNIMDPFIQSEQRNWALDNLNINTEWVLFIDADEEVTQDLAGRICQETKNASSDTTLFQLAPKFMFMGKWLKNTQSFPVWHDRLVRHGAVTFKGGVWEEADTKGKVKKIKEPYLHYGFRKGLEPWLKKHVVYAEDRARILNNMSVEKNIGMFKNLHALVNGSLSKSSAIQLLAARVLPLGAIGRFVYQYFVKRGFLDGWPGFVYCNLMIVYQLMISCFYIEKKLIKSGSSM